MPLRTVIVLGAGASYEFGLPVGEGLKHQISNFLDYRYESGQLANGDEFIYNALRIAEQEAGTRVMDRFLASARSIAQGLLLTYSIDNYLNNHRDDNAIALCGKLGIVRAILNAEAKSRIYSRDGSVPFKDCENTWAVKLVRALTEQCTVQDIKRRLSNVTFIVFNYDRCLEHMLMNALAVAYRISQKDAAEIVNGIAIYHPYGRVGALPWINAKDGEEVIEYGGEVDPGKLYRLTKGIKTFTEGTDEDDSDILAIRGSVKSAERFIFLGYAYHKLNMNLIGKGVEVYPQPQTYGTSFGMSEHDRNSVHSMLNSSYFGTPNVRNVTCDQLFHEYGRALSFL